MIAETCKTIELEKSLSNIELFEEFDLTDGHPWVSNINSNHANYYNCLYKIANREKPRRILELGTAFGLSAATMLKASPNIELFVSLDLGIYGEQLGFSQNNIDFARTRIHQWCCHRKIPLNRIRFYRANSQPGVVGDNENFGVEIRKWYDIPDLVRLLTHYEFDVIFVDGKHTDDGLYNDFVTVWQLLRDGGLIICDDLHDEKTYGKIFSWAGQTLESFHRFTNEHKAEIDDQYIWNYPRVMPMDYTGLRPFGLIRKKKRMILELTKKWFDFFNKQESLAIIQARQDHLASLGLDLSYKSVLEVGCGIGKDTCFFEKLGCTIHSTDSRPENVAEYLRRRPDRKGFVDIVDLNCSNSHVKFGKFNIVYCYGTLHQLENPSQCLKELSKNCKDLFLLETCVNSLDNGNINSVYADDQGEDKPFNEIKCRPARDWIMQELKKYYPYVYCTRTQPAHSDYPIIWPANREEFINTRCVFVASKRVLCHPTLIPDIPQSQGRLEPII